MAYDTLKNIYNEAFYKQFLSALSKVVPEVDKKDFNNQIFTENWHKLELKDRMRHSRFVLKNFLDEDFEIACRQIIQTLELFEFKAVKYPELTLLFLPDYVETYGKNHFDISMKAIEKITPFTSCEFAVRAFIIQNQERALEYLISWSKHNNFHVRRLASEGCRPKLPWGMALKEFQRDPSPILPILENLKHDKEDYVYRSVANNLNDISKDHPDLVLSIAKKWKNKSKTTDWLIKHSLRTLLKAGDQSAMQIFGYGKPGNAKIDLFRVKNQQINVGDYLEFNFDLLNKNKAINRLEYAIYFLKQNGNLGKKVFKISEKEYPENSITRIEKRHSFKKISTRKYYFGVHKVSIIINGIESESFKFILN